MFARTRHISWTSWLIVAVTIGAQTAAYGDEAPTYERDIKPLFAKRCTVCHSRKNLENADVSAGLALDSYEAIQAGTADHRVLDPGNPDVSVLYQRLGDPDEERRMPLAEKPLAAIQRDLVRRWIDAGAPRGVSIAQDSPPQTTGKPSPRRRIVRTLDVKVPTEAKAPAGTEEWGTGGSVQLMLKVGPLPAVTALKLRGDGRLLAVGTFGTVVVWDTEQGKPSRTLSEIPGQVHSLAFRHDGGMLAVGAGLPARSGVVRIYSVPEGSLVFDLPGHSDVVAGVAFSPDGQHLASASFDQTVRLWDLSGGQGKELGLFHGHSDFVSEVAFTADGTTLLSTGKDRSVKRIDRATLKERRTYSDHNEDIHTLAVHPGGARFVTAGDEPQIRWWGLDDEKPAMKVGGHSGPVHQLVFSGNGQRLLSAGADGTVRLWDGTTGGSIRSLPGATEWQYAATLSDDGRCAAAAGWDGLVRVWDTETARLRATLLQPPAASTSEAATAATDWAIVVPGGFTAASGALQPLLRWQVGAREVSVETASSRFLKPEEVAKALQGRRTTDPFAPINQDERKETTP